MEDYPLLRSCARSLAVIQHIWLCTEPETSTQSNAKISENRTLPWFELRMCPCGMCNGSHFFLIFIGAIACVLVRSFLRVWSDCDCVHHDVHVCFTCVSYFGVERLCAAKFCVVKSGACACAHSPHASHSDGFQ